MRNLRILREKSFAGCLGKLKVYVADPAEGDLEIDGVLCRKLGELKNGEEKAFPIGDGSVDVYVIADKMSRNYYYEKRTIEAGEEDVALSGKVHFNPLAGNPFQFEGEVSEEVAQKRRKTGRKSAVLIIACALLGVLVGKFIGGALVSSGSNDPKVFTAENLSITLTEQFRSTRAEGFTKAWQGKDVMVLTLQEPFTLMEGLEDYSLQQYAQLVLQANGREADSLKQEDGLLWFEYDWTNTEVKTTYRYYVYLYKADDAFWLVQFVANAKDAAGYAGQFAQWAKSVTFS